MNTLTATNVEGIIQDVKQAIEDGENAKQRIAAGIWEIHQYKLWEKTHLSFEDFVSEHFGFELRRAQQLVKFYKTHRKLLKVCGDTNNFVRFELQNEGQAREISSVPEEKLPTVIQKAQKLAGPKPVTAKHLKEARQEVVPPKPKAPKKTQVEQDRRPNPRNWHDGQERSDVYMKGLGLKRIIGPLIRTIDEMAEMNGGRGPAHKRAERGINEVLEALDEMMQGVK